MRRTTIHVLILAALAACNGTRTGNPVEPGGTEPGGGHQSGAGNLGEGAVGNCDPKPSDLDSLDEQTRLGFSANDVLAFASGVHETKIRWHADEFATLAPESGEHGLRIEITRASGKARFVAYEEHMSSGDQGGPTIDIGLLYADCMSLGAVEIDVDVAVRSDGGALDEMAHGTLRATNASWATLDLHIKTKDIGGKLVLQASKPAGFELDAIAIALGVSPFGVRGSLDVEVSSPPTGNAVGGMTNPGGAAGRGGAAAIGDSADCDDGGFAVALDDKLHAFTAQDAIDRVNVLKHVALSWDGGANASATFVFAPDDPGAACAMPDSAQLQVTSPDAQGQLRVRGTLHVSSDDARIDADWPVALDAFAAADGTLGDLMVSLPPSNLLDAMTLDVAATYGITGIDTSGYDAARLAFMLQVAAGAAADATGTFSVNGIKHAICPPPPTDPSVSTPGCRGDDVTVLAAATFGQ